MTGRIIWDREKFEVRIEMKSQGRIEAQRLALLNLLILGGHAKLDVMMTRADASMIRQMDRGWENCEVRLVLTPQPGTPEDLLRRIATENRIEVDGPAQLALPMPTENCSADSNRPS